MEELNRAAEPALRWDDRVAFPQYQRWTLAGNGLPAYAMPSQQGVQQLILSFAAEGVGAHPMVHGATAELMLRGSMAREAREVNYAIDLWGASLRGVHTRDRNTLSMQCTDRFAPKALELLQELVHTPSFEMRVIDNWRAKQLANFHIAQQRPTTVAAHALRRALYPNHPYGYVPREEDFHLVQRSSLIACWQEAFTSPRCTLFYSGRDDEAMRALLQEAWGLRRWGVGSEVPPRVGPWHQAARDGLVRNEAAQQAQSALAMGRLLPNLPHIEMVPLSMAVMLLGGYFGSRLVANLREEHGYTYGIQAYLSLHAQANAVGIQSEVGNEFLPAAVKEIHHELVQLQAAPPAPEKLREVKAYMVGELLRRYDGPHRAVSSMMPDVLFADRGADFQQRWLRRLLATTGQEVQAAAREWLAPEAFTLSVAGPAEAIGGVEWPTRREL